MPVDYKRALQRLAAERAAEMDAAEPAAAATGRAMEKV